MEGVIEEVSGLKEFGALTHLIEGGQRRVRAGSVFGAASALIASALSVKGKIPVLFLCANTERQRDVFDDFCSFGMNPLLFPQLLEGAERRVNAALERDRLRILESLRSDAPTITVATFRSVEQSVPSPELLSGRFLKIKVADNLSPQELVRRLEKASYEVSDFVGVPGEYSRRGGIVDVYPFDSPAPCRIEFFGDEVESIRLFDEGTQQTKRIVEEVEILLRADGEAKEGTVFDFLPRDGLVVVEGVLPSGKKEVNEASLVSLLLSFKSIFFSATPTEAEEDSVNFPFTPARVLGADMGAVMGYLEECSKDCKKLFLFFPTEGDKERFLEISEEKTRERIVLQNGAISGGFIAPQVFAVLSYSQMFGKSRLPPQPEAKAPSFSLEIEMAPGDFCVHTDYGICRFRGVHRGGEVGMKEESLVFEFSEGALLYLPVLEVEKVHRYIGAGRASPPLSRLGDTTWVRRKERVKESLGRLAEELLLVQAKRMVNRRASYPRDSVSQREFEAAFPYSETEDQLKAVDKVKRAMESTRPMDFLVAGDVGYGKTEIAMRAAFKAVEFGKQVAVLVPTTLLSEQHFRTFSERFADYPIIVEVLSRFRKPAEQRAVIDALKEGRIDIIIGTHRLLSRDVEFHDLGLVIIDEEQRFGVEQKEHFKRLRASVDVLSLTATPIPRTLNIALAGIKDMAVLATPPPQKLSVLTKVAQFSMGLVREAIVRELARNGQIFFVHNRVRSIEQIWRQLVKTVPEARFAVAHGQMDEYQLSRTMGEFLERRIDVLVTTTIIESGLDIPTVNTLIVNNAHTFGLADLHQLRGRIGRHSEQAFAYFLVPSFEKLCYSARQRLRTIEEFSRLGAGFQIALRDLEIRGAGNILGREQAGLIHAVGYDLYVRLLSQTIARLKKQPVKERLFVEIAIPLEAFIPQEYISDLRQRIEMYRQIAAASDSASLEGVKSRMKDIYGRTPNEVENLFLKAELSLRLEALSVEHISLKKEGILMRYREREKIAHLVRSEDFWLVGEDSLYLRLPHAIRNDPLKTVLYILDLLG